MTVVAWLVVLVFLASTVLFHYALRKQHEDDVLEFVRVRGEASSLLLSERFGQRVYPTLRRLAARGRLVRVEGSGSPQRGGRPAVSYRFPR